MFSRWWAKLRRLFGSRKPLAAPVPPPPPPPPPPTSSILANTAIPVITGAAIVGQTLFCSTGTWSGSPASFSFAWFNDDGAIEGIGDTYTVQDAQVGKSIRCEVTAVNGLGVSAPVSSVATSAVADVNLASAITSVTRTSTSGTIPMTADIAFASNVYEGYTLRRTVWTDSGLSALKGEGVHLLTNADLQAGATIDWSSDGGPTIAATDWVQYTVQTTTPNGIYKSFTYGTAISPTDAVTAMTWNSLDKTSTVTLTNANMTATGSGAADNQFVRANRGISSGKKYWEVSIDAATGLHLSVSDTSAPSSLLWTRAAYGGADTPDAADYENNGFIFYNGTENSGHTSFANGQRFQVALDATNKKVWFGINNTWQNGDPAAGTGGTAMASILTPIFPSAQFHFGGSATLKPAATDWTYSAPTGFSAP